MLFKLELKPKHSNCPHCESTDTFMSVYNGGRYCLNCNQKYDRADEVRLREKKMDEAQWVI